MFDEWRQGRLPRLGDRISGDAILREGLMLDETLREEPPPSLPVSRPSGASGRKAWRFREELEAALVEADRGGSHWPALHGDALIDAADETVAEAIRRDRRDLLAAPRRRRRHTTSELREALGLGEDNRR